MKNIKVLVLTGYGINCEEETAFAFELVGAKANIVHINDLINNGVKLKNYQIMAFPGGFSYGDDTGSGNAYANRVRNHLWDKVEEYIQNDHLVIGICNGFQILVNLGLLPALDNYYGERQVALTHNNTARYIDRWVDLEIKNDSPWLKNIKKISLPIAHGEGKFYASREILRKLESNKQIAAKYIEGEMCEYQNLKSNPNGSLKDIAGITNKSGKIFGVMPHPERAIYFTQLPNWPILKEKFKRKRKRIPKYGPGLDVFRNGVNYFR